MPKLSEDILKPICLALALINTCSVYTFTYISANLVHCYGRGIVTTGTIATDATASVTGGI